MKKEIEKQTAPHGENSLANVKSPSADDPAEVVEKKLESLCPSDVTACSTSLIEWVPVSTGMSEPSSTNVVRGMDCLVRGKELNQDHNG